MAREHTAPIDRVAGKPKHPPMPGQRADDEGKVIWEFSDNLTRWLLRWALLSMAGGSALAASQDPLARGIGHQFVGWGLIDALVAIGGRRFSARRQARAEVDPSLVQKEARNLRRLLWINAGLDVLYVLGGALLARSRGRRNAYWRGQGLAIIFQGTFHLVFDVWHGLKVPAERG